MSGGGGAQGPKSSGKFGRGGGKGHKDIALNLTPMIDMMTILLVFLVMTFSADPAALTNTQGITLSQVKVSSEKPADVSIITLTDKEMLLDGKVICPLIIHPKDGKLAFPDSAFHGSYFIEPLKAELQRQADIAKQIAAVNPSRPFKGEILLHADRALPFATLKPVLRSAGNAGFRQIKIAAKGLN